MKNLSRKFNGCVFAAFGGLFALIGGGMLLVQLLVTGEWLFDGEVNGKHVEDIPIGVEFASVFLSFGLAFSFLGASTSVRSIRGRTIAFGLTIAQFAVAALAFGAIVLGSMGMDVGGLLLLVWPLLLVLGAVLAALHPNFKHGAEMERLTPPVRDPGGEPAKWAAGASPSKVQDIAAKGGIAPKGGVGPVSELATPSPSALPAGAWKGALITAAIVGLFPVVFFSIFILAVRPKDDPTPILFLGVFLIFASALFAVPTFVAVLLFQVLARATAPTLSGAYRGFAARVGGEVVEQKLPPLGIAMPKAVLLTHGKTPCVLDLEIIPSGEHSTTYSRFTFELSSDPGFRCQVLPQGLLSGVGALLGAQDVQLGWDVFDDQFVVKASDEVLIRKVLSRGAQEQLLALKQFADSNADANEIGMGRVDLTIQERRLQVRIRAFLNTEEKLHAYYQACTRLFDKVARDLASAASSSADRAPPGWG